MQENNTQPLDRTKTTLVRRRAGESLTGYVLRFMQAYQIQHSGVSFYRPRVRVKPGK